MEFTLPQTNPEILPFAAGTLTVLFGLFAMFMPGSTLWLLKLQAPPVTPEACAEMRSSVGGFYIGVGLMAVLMFDQPIVQLMLGGAWTVAAFGRFVGLLTDTGGTLRGVVGLLVQLSLAAMLLAPAFNLVAG